MKRINDGIKAVDLFMMLCYNNFTVVKGVYDMGYVSLNDKVEYRKILDALFLYCTDFIAIYPNDETEEDYRIGNPLLCWKNDFLALSDIHVATYGGMKNGIEIHGKLSEAAKSIMYSALDTRGIWQYSLWKDDLKIFEASDFDDGFIFEYN